MADEKVGKTPERPRPESGVVVVIDWLALVDINVDTLAWNFLTDLPKTKTPPETYDIDKIGTWTHEDWEKFLKPLIAYRQKQFQKRENYKESVGAIAQDMAAICVTNIKKIAGILEGIKKRKLVELYEPVSELAELFMPALPTTSKPADIRAYIQFLIRKNVDIVFIAPYVSFPGVVAINTRDLPAYLRDVIKLSDAEIAKIHIEQSSPDDTTLPRISDTFQLQKGREDAIFVGDAIFVVEGDQGLKDKLGSSWHLIKPKYYMVEVPEKNPLFCLFGDEAFKQRVQGPYPKASPLEAKVAAPSAASLAASSSSLSAPSSSSSAAKPVDIKEKKGVVEVSDSKQLAQLKKKFDDALGFFLPKDEHELDFDKEQSDFYMALEVEKATATMFLILLEMEKLAKPPQDPKIFSDALRDFREALERWADDASTKSPKPPIDESDPQVQKQLQVGALKALIIRGAVDRMATYIEIHPEYEHSRVKTELLDPCLALSQPKRADQPRETLYPFLQFVTGLPKLPKGILAEQYAGLSSAYGNAVTAANKTPLLIPTPVKDEKALDAELDELRKKRKQYVEKIGELVSGKPDIKGSETDVAYWAKVRGEIRKLEKLGEWVDDIHRAYSGEKFKRIRQQCSDFMGNPLVTDPMRQSAAALARSISGLMGRFDGGRLYRSYENPQLLASDRLAARSELRELALKIALLRSFMSRREYASFKKEPGDFTEYTVANLDKDLENFKKGIAAAAGRAGKIPFEIQEKMDEIDQIMGQATNELNNFGAPRPEAPKPDVKGRPIVIPRPLTSRAVTSSSSAASASSITSSSSASAPAPISAAQREAEAQREIALFINKQIVDLEMLLKQKKETESKAKTGLLGRLTKTKQPDDAQWQKEAGDVHNMLEAFFEARLKLDELNEPTKGLVSEQLESIQASIAVYLQHRTPLASDVDKNPVVTRPRGLWSTVEALSNLNAVKRSLGREERLPTARIERDEQLDILLGEIGELIARADITSDTPVTEVKEVGNTLTGIMGNLIAADIRLFNQAGEQEIRTKQLNPAVMGLQKKLGTWSDSIRTEYQENEEALRGADTLTSAQEKLVRRWVMQAEAVKAMYDVLQQKYAALAQYKTPPPPPEIVADAKALEQFKQTQVKAEEKAKQRTLILDQFSRMIGTFPFLQRKKSPEERGPSFVAPFWELLTRDPTSAVAKYIQQVRGEYAAEVQQQAEEEAAGPMSLIGILSSIEGTGGGTRKPTEDKAKEEKKEEKMAKPGSPKPAAGGGLTASSYSASSGFSKEDKKQTTSRYFAEEPDEERNEVAASSSFSSSARASASSSAASSSLSSPASMRASGFGRFLGKAGKTDKVLSTELNKPFEKLFDAAVTGITSFNDPENAQRREDSLEKELAKMLVPYHAACKLFYELQPANPVWAAGAKQRLLEIQKVIDGAIPLSQFPRTDKPLEGIKNVVNRKIQEGRREKILPKNELWRVQQIEGAMGELSPSTLRTVREEERAAEAKRSVSSASSSSASAGEAESSPDSLSKK